MSRYAHLPPKRHVTRHIEGPQGYTGGPNGPAVVPRDTRGRGHVEIRGVPEPSGYGPDLWPHALPGAPPGVQPEGRRGAHCQPEGAARLKQARRAPWPAGAIRPKYCLAAL
jgi:hypothetical protein